jgi:hypothetical protein
MMRIVAQALGKAYYGIQLNIEPTTKMRADHSDIVNVGMMRKSMNLQNI